MGPPVQFGKRSFILLLHDCVWFCEWLQLPKREPSEKDLENEMIAEQVEGNFSTAMGMGMGGSGGMDLDEQPPILTNEDKKHQVDRQLSSQGWISRQTF